MSAIGILGGMGPHASARLYELLIADSTRYMQTAAHKEYPKIILLSLPVPNFISNTRSIPDAKRILLDATGTLEQAGCTINAIACNTAHLLLPELQAVTQVPFVSIPELVATHVRTRSYTRVGLLATPTTLASTLYDDALDPGVVLIRPDENFARTVQHYIYQLLNGTLRPRDRQAFTQQVQSFKRSCQLDAVILGCTELPLVYGPSDESYIIDTLQVLADGLLVQYYQASSH